MNTAVPGWRLDDASFRLATVGLAVAMSAGALGGFSYLLDLASRFQVQYLLCALLSTIYFACRRQRW